MFQILILMLCVVVNGKTQEERLNELESSLSKYTAIEERLLQLDNVEKLAAKCDRYEANMKRHDEMEARLKQMERRLAVINKGNNVYRTVVAEGIAFSTTLTINRNNLGLNQVLKFNKVLLNDGNGYNVITGVFTAPVAGVYMFTYFLAHHYTSTNQAWLELMHNGVKMNAAVSDQFHSYQDLQGGNSAIFRVGAGDSVWLETWHQNNEAISGEYGFTSFSGTLLYS